MLEHLERLAVRVAEGDEASLCSLRQLVNSVIALNNAEQTAWLRLTLDQLIKAAPASFSSRLAALDHDLAQKQAELDAARARRRRRDERMGIS